MYNLWHLTNSNRSVYLKCDVKLMWISQYYQCIPSYLSLVFKSCCRHQMSFEHKSDNEEFLLNVWDRVDLFPVLYQTKNLGKGSMQPAKYCIKKPVSSLGKQFRITVSSQICSSVIFRKRSNMMFVCLLFL